MTLLDDFLIRAALAGVGAAVAAGPLGCFVAWRRMAYFGDATAHAAVLGVALSLALSVSIFAGVLVVSMAMAYAVSALSGPKYGADTILGVLSHCALAIGLVALSLVKGARFDLMAYLTGDILAIGVTDLALIWGAAAAVLALLAWRWSALLTATLSPDIAQSAEIRPQREQLVLTLTIALVVAAAIKVVGVLLIGSLLLIPAATARSFCATPERMAAAAGSIGCTAALGGIWVSYAADTPSGPTIVCVLAALFALSLIARAALGAAQHSTAAQEDRRE